MSHSPSSPYPLANRPWSSVAVQVGCAMAYRDPFVLPLSSDQKQRAERAKQELADATMSDHLALVNALNAYEKVRTHPASTTREGAARQGRQEGATR